MEPARDREPLGKGGVEDAPALVRVLPWALFAVALLARLYGLGEESLWFDEGQSLLHAREPIGFSDVRPLYYLLLRGWMRFGNTEAFLRLPAALFGAVSVPLLWGLGRPLLGWRAATVGAALLAVAGTDVDVSQQVRMYSLTVLLTVLALWLLMRWSVTARTTTLVAHAFAAMAALLASPVAFLGLIPGTVVVLGAAAVRGKRLLAALGAQGVVLVLWLVRAVGATRELSVVGEAGNWATPPKLLSLVNLPGWLLAGHTGFPSPGEWSRPVVWLVSATAIVMVALAVAAPGETGRARRLLTVSLVVVAGGVWAYSVTVNSVWVSRYFAALVPLLCLAVGAGAVELRKLRPGLAAAAGAILLAAMVTSLVHYYATPVRRDWRGVGLWLQANARPGDSVTMIGWVPPVLTYYFPGPPAPVPRRWKPRSADEPAAATLARVLESRWPAPGDRALVVDEQPFATDLVAAAREVATQRGLDPAVVTAFRRREFIVVTIPTSASSAGHEGGVGGP